MKSLAPSFPSSPVAIFGRVLFAAGLVAFGVLQFVFKDFIPGRAPSWPEALPGKLAWAYATGLVFIATGVTVSVRRAPRWLLGVALALIALWALVRLVPPVVADTWLGGTWTQAGKAIVLLTGLVALHPKLISGREEHSRQLGCLGLGAFLILTGLQHFRWTEFVVSLVPLWMPGGGLFWTYASAVFLIAGGIGLLVPRVTYLAALLSGIMIFLWVFMVHAPRAWANGDQGEWTAVFEALAFSGLAFALTQKRPHPEPVEPRG